MITGDNYALALAYFQTSLPDEGFALLQGNMMHDMYHYMIPGGLGAHNGGACFLFVAVIFNRKCRVRPLVWVFQQEM